MKTKQIVLSRKFDTALLLVLMAAITFLTIRSSILGLADTGIYLDIGKLVFSGENPYNYNVRTGSLGALSIYILSLFIPHILEPIMFQLLNIVGVFVFLFRIVPLKLQKRHFLLLYLILIFSSPVREMLSTHQINGIVLGVLSFALRFPDSSARFHKLGILLQSAGIAIVTDLKPHLAIGGILIALFFYKNYRVIIFSIISYILAYTVLYSYIGANLHWRWLMNIRNVDDLDVSNKWNDVSNVWPILDALFGFQHFWYFSSLFFSFLLFAIISVSAVRGRLSYAVVFWSIWPVFSNYSHLYDLLLLTILVLLFLLISNNAWSGILVIVFIIVPQQIYVLSNFILVSGLTVAFVLGKKIVFADVTKSKQSTNFMVLLVPLFYWINGLNHSPQMSSSLRVFEIFLLSIFPIWQYAKNYAPTPK